MKKNKAPKSHLIVVENELMDEVRAYSKREGHQIKWVAAKALRRYLDHVKGAEIK